jgi:hypothetical protein
MPFFAAVAEHCPALSEKGREPYKLAWAFFGPLKQKKMRDIRTVDVQKLADAQVIKGRSRSQCKNIKGHVSQLCKVAMREDILDKNRMIPIHPEILIYVQDFISKATGDLFLSGYAAPYL